MTREILIRAATVADRGAAIRLLTAQLVEHQLPADADGIARGVELAFAKGSSAWLILATVSGIPAGILLANPIVSVEKGGAALWVEELYVAPAHRRHGVARALLDHLVVEARNNGMRAIDLEVVKTQGAALALYRGLGFAFVDRARFTLDL
ncbi:MAG: GNAT family N-acetyltransferase [Myxococcales bacterium]|nr:GNAT family N-acetyltransferase [Myxococcales bacterium]